MESKALPEGKYLDIDNGLRLHYHEQGEGLPVIFIHGSGQGASGFSNFCQNSPYFAEHGFRALMPDLPGFGYSSTPEDAKYELDFYVSAIKQFVDGLGLKSLVLVGNSLGGAISLKFAMDYPDYISKLILMAPGGIEPQEVYAQMSGLHALFRVVYSPDPISREGLRSVLSLQLWDESLLTDQIVEERYAIAKDQPKAVWTTMKVPFLGGDLEKITCPVLVFWGSDDRFLPVSGAQVMAKNCPNSRTIVFSRCGHWVMAEHTDLFNKYSVDFLRE